MLTREQIKDAIYKIAPQYSIEQVYLFGSYARGDATEESDVDFRIVGGNFPSLYEIGGLYEDLIESLDKKIDVVFTKNLRFDFYTMIKDDEVMVFG